MARSSAYTDELALEICSRIASGESLVRICKDERMPDITTVYRWLREQPDFREIYVIAREDQADTLGDEIKEISDETPIIVKLDDNGEEVEVVFDAAAIQRQRLRVDARKFIAAKLKPKKWGDRTELVGAGGEPLIPNNPETMFEGVRRIAFILAKVAHDAAPEEPLPITAHQDAGDQTKGIARFMFPEPPKQGVARGLINPAAKTKRRG